MNNRYVCKAGSCQVSCGISGCICFYNEENGRCWCAPCGTLVVQRPIVVRLRKLGLTPQSLHVTMSAKNVPLSFIAKVLSVAVPSSKLAVPAALGDKIVANVAIKNRSFSSITKRLKLIDLKQSARKR